jgi:mono/diheme cytochrome c family protein
MLVQGDGNLDQQLSRDELMMVGEVWFRLLDPDRQGVVRQDEFVATFKTLLLSEGAQSPARGFAAASAAMGFFIAADQDHDASLTGAELKQAFRRWFYLWDVDGTSALAQSEMVNGLNAVLPRTNMSGVSARASQDSIPGLPTPPPAPVLAPKESMAAIQVVDGFKLELAASEPMIEDPVALTFDEDGRAYVVEMRGYMRDIDRSGEREPISRISRLEDTDRDGRFDRATVFVDELILPRAVAAVSGGILYVSDYMLYFAQDTDGDGRADRIELLDAEYGRGNVEHAPNALFRAMDNWIYNGESPYRYRLVGSTLIKQVTEVRGQWGMTQDNYGRLHYNVNNSQLLGDLAPPNYMGRNLHYPSSAGLNLFVATDQRVFPIRMTTAINRGYSPEVLNPEGKAYVFASSCSPLIYRGDNFPPEFVGNAFVADPALNLIKRNLVFDQNLTLTSQFAYADREFLASTDERFRPSNLYNAPDGTLWFVDLYRGIAQYGQFMTDYLRRETLARGLEQGIHLGRIYRIVSTAKKPASVPQLSATSSAELVTRLSDSNGWIRDTAQRLLVERGDRSVGAALSDLVENGVEPLSRIHALSTLEGLFASVPGEEIGKRAEARDFPILLKVDPSFRLEASDLPTEVWRTCLNAIGDADPKIQVAAIRVAEAFATGDPGRQRALLVVLDRLAEKSGEETLFQAALSAGNLTKPDVLPLFARIIKRAGEHRLIREAVMSGLQNYELEFLHLLFADPQWKEQRPGRFVLLQALANSVITERNPANIDALLTLAASQRSDEAWRRHSLIEGIAANVGSKPAQLIALPSAPTAFGSLAKWDDAKTRESAERIKSLFTWPGHQSERAAGVRAPRALTAAEEASMVDGKNLYQQLCAGCHGLVGQGTVPMAPPLANSDWVLGSEEQLIRIVLQGVAGPINVNGTAYRPPNILPEMPGLAMLEDAQIASVLSYVRRAWDHAAEPISTTQVSNVREKTKTQKTPWTEEQLLEIR